MEWLKIQTMQLMFVMPFLTTYGVNGLSVMNRVDNFDVRQCFPEHIMHILFDGVVRYETKRFLKS